MPALTSEPVLWETRMDKFKAEMSGLLSPHESHLVEFTLFPDLPMELRQKIWRHTLPPPRAVLISLYHDSERPFTVDSLPTLWVNQESRTETLGEYRLVLRPDNPYYLQVIVIGKNDTPAIMATEVASYSHDLMQLLRRVTSRIPGGLAVFEKLEIIAMPLSTALTEPEVCVSRFKQLFMKFSGLKDLYLAVRGEEEVGIWNIKVRNFFNEQVTKKALLSAPNIHARTQTVHERIEESLWMMHSLDQLQLRMRIRKYGEEVAFEMVLDDQQQIGGADTLRGLIARDNNNPQTLVSNFHTAMNINAGLVRDPNSRRSSRRSSRNELHNRLAEPRRVRSKFVSSAKRNLRF